MQQVATIRTVLYIVQLYYNCRSAKKFLLYSNTFVPMRDTTRPPANNPWHVQIICTMVYGIVSNLNISTPNTEQQLAEELTDKIIF